MFNIVCLMVFVTCMVFTYMNHPQLPSIYALCSDMAMFVSLLLYIFVLKFKSVVGLVLNCVLLSAACGLKFYDIVSRSTAAPIDVVILACMGILFLELAFASFVWKMVPTTKWIKKFDLTSKLSVTVK